MNARLAIVLVLTLLTGCGRAHLFYDTRELRHEPLERQQEAALNQTVLDRLGGRSVTWIDDDGRTKVIAAAEIAKLGLAERGALWLALSSGEPGGENDVRVRLGKSARGAREGRSTPVSVYLGLDGTVRLTSGKSERDDEPAPELSAIRARFALKGKTPGTWNDSERRALAESLASLAPPELEVVRDIDFDREAQPRDRDLSRAALFEMRGCRAQITVYTSSLRADAFRFVGDTKAPKSAVLHSIVHEIGHAFEQSAARAKYCAAARATGDAANDLVRAGNELTADSPVMAAYLRALDGDPAPTDYGNASTHESFAESFSLFHVDPEALKRARPKVFAWFAKGGHLAGRTRS